MQSELDLLEEKAKEVTLTELKAKNAELMVEKANLEAKNAEYIKLKDETAKLKTENTKLLTQIIEKYAKNKADRKKSEYSHLVTVFDKKNRKFQAKCVKIAVDILNEKPIIEYRPPFLNGLELDAFFQKYQIALEVQGSQHRLHSTSWYKDIKRFEDIVDRDRKKRCLCQLNGIFLLEVWYDENPEKVIPERIQKIKDFVNQAFKVFDL
ncbi:13247_t:CDS:2 [Dentiscutata erythropus]|uniref:13247_t:CDS:1 n=1 Tax=Dentiscutata erythropus TaxID=1348616 RepID=A0A9N9JMS2_9GLOM|nr:13247_t:CDS:2 [Dentiscutata erythropus]